MRTYDIAEYFKNRFAAIVSYKDRIQKVRLIPEITDSYGKEYFRMNLKIEHDVLLSFKSIDKYTEKDIHEREIRQILSPQKNRNGYAFVSSKLSEEDYWLSLRDNFEQYELVGELLREMLEPFRSESPFQLEIEPADSLPEYDLIVKYFSKMNFHRRSYEQLVGKNPDDELVWEKRLAHCQVSNWDMDSAKVQMIDETKFDRILEGSGDSALDFTYEHEISFRSRRTFKRFNLYEIREVMQKSPSRYQTALQRIRTKLGEVEERRVESERKEKTVVNSVGFNPGEIIIIPKSASWGRIWDETLIVAKIDSIEAKYERVQVKYRIVTSNLKSGSKISEVDQQFIKWSCSEETFGKVVRENGFKHSKNFLTWALAQIEQGKS